MKPDFEAVVYVKPTVWVANPIKRSNPINPPFISASFFIFLILEKANRVNNTVAMQKRRATNSIGEVSFNPPLTTTKVPPQIIVETRRRSSAFVLNFIKHFSRRYSLIGADGRGCDSHNDKKVLTNRIHSKASYPRTSAFISEYPRLPRASARLGRIGFKEVSPL